MVDSESALAIALFGEILTVHQLIRIQLDRVLPKGMELSHFSVLNHLANTKGEKTPAQLAKSFHVTRGVRPDWDDARRKLVAISPAGVRARDDAIALVAPVISELVRDSGADEIKSVLPVLRNLRIHLE